MSLAAMIAARIQPRALLGDNATALPAEGDDAADAAEAALLRASGPGWSVRRWGQGGGALARLAPPGEFGAESGPALVVVDGSPIAVCAAGAPVLDAGPGAVAQSPAEALARGWLRWGLGLLPRLHGPFALVLWNLRSAEVLLTRDALGLQPLYLTDASLAGAIDPDAIAPARAPGAARAEGALAAASSIGLLRALLKPGSMGSEAVDEAAIADQLLGVFAPPGRTIYRGIVAVEPGQWITIDADARRSAGHWWRPRQRQRRPSDLSQASPRALARAAEELRARLDAAVARSLAADPRATATGLWLSGGLDSSAVGCVVARGLAARGDRDALSTCSLAFPGMRGADESRYIAAFRRQYPSRHGVRNLLEVDPAAHLRALAAACGQPMLLANHAFSWTLARLARDQGCAAVFTGHDGDSTIGYRWMHLGDLAVGNPPLALATLSALHRTHSERYLSLFDQGIWTPWRARVRGLLRLESPLPMSLASARADLLARTGAWERARAQWAGSADEARSADEEHLREVTASGFRHATTYLAHLGQAHGLSLHHPLADRALVDFALSLPANVAQARGWSRHVLRAAVADSLPRVLAWRRRKAHLSAPLYRALSANGQASVRALIEDAPPRLWEWSDRPHAEALLQRLAREPWQALQDDTMLGLWHLLWLAAWLANER